MEKGPLAGYPVVDVAVALFFGKYHDVDSSEMAFKIAAETCFHQVMMEARPILLEPIEEIAVRVPEEFLGDVMGDLSSRRGKILGTDVGRLAPDHPGAGADRGALQVRDAPALADAGPGHALGAGSLTTRKCRAS